MYKVGKVEWSQLFSSPVEVHCVHSITFGEQPTETRIMYVLQRAIFFLSAYVLMQTMAA